MSKRNLFILLTGLSIALAGCNDKNKMLVSQDEMQELLDLSSGNESYGMVYFLYRAADMQRIADSLCHPAFDSSYSVVSEDGYLNLAQTLIINYNYYYVCDSVFAGTVFSHMEADTLYYNFNASGNTENARVQISNNYNGILHIGDLRTASSTYTIGGNLFANGTFRSNFNQQSNVTYDIKIDFYSVSLQKSNLMITGGTGYFELDVETEDGHNASYDGTFTFMGDYKVTATIEGRDYLFEIR